MSDLAERLHRCSAMRDLKRSSAKYRHSGGGRNPCLTWQSVFIVALQCANGYSKRHRRPPAGSLLLPEHTLHGWIFMYRELQLLLTRSVQYAQLIADNFSGVPLDAIFAGPLAGLQMALDVHQRTFSQMLPGELGESFVQHDPVPFGRFAPGAGGFVFPGFTGRNRQMGDGFATVHRTYIRIMAEVADQQGFVQRSSHHGVLGFVVRHAHIMLERDARCSAQIQARLCAAP